LFADLRIPARRLWRNADFALGAGGIPKTILEAPPYDRLTVELRNGSDARSFLLESSLTPRKRARNDGPTYVSRAQTEETSQLLLSLSGLIGKRVLADKYGKTRPLDFSDVARLILVDEKRIVSERSPIVRGINRVAETAVFRLMLTGFDDSCILDEKEPKVVPSRTEGKIDIIKEFLDRTRAEIEQMSVERDRLTLQARLGRIQERFDQITAESRTKLQSLRKLEEQNRRTWIALRQLNLRDERRRRRDPFPEAPAERAERSVGADEGKQSSHEVEALLGAWHFPNLAGVIYSEEDQDLLISGRRRSDYGRGVRALTHAAFKLGLMKYCVSQSLPHPGLVVIDSPLVVYRRPDAGESEFRREVRDSFFRSLAEFKDAQVVIFENEEPSGDLENIANIVRFTGTDQPRLGFM